MLNKSQLDHIKNLLIKGGVIAYPTESVYGLGCDPSNLQAIQKILDIKKRPSHKGLILLVSNITQAFPYIQPLSANQLELINQKQDRATTWLMPKNKSLSPLLCGKHDKIAIRVTQHPIAQAICISLNGALVSTSCNLAGKAEMKTVLEVRNKMNCQVDKIINGICGGQNPSQIIDLLSGQIIRS